MSGSPSAAVSVDAWRRGARHAEEVSVQAVTVLHHRESGVWWAESPDVVGFSAAADGLAELRQPVSRTLDDVLGSGHYVVREFADSTAPGATPGA
jgi:predicted RNase H-like HicB family nuclease